MYLTNSKIKKPAKESHKAPGNPNNNSSSSSSSIRSSQSVEQSLRIHLFRSLTRIERHLSRRDPQTLRLIREWYSGRSNETTSPQRLRLNFRQRRMEQNEIDNAALEYLKIPPGVATRSLLVPPQPDWLFSDALPSHLSLDPGFSWLPDSNVSNAMESTRRSRKREMMKQYFEDWIFLFFRILRVNWESTVVEEKKTTGDVNMYAEENLSKWTIKLRFKIMRQIPVKVALIAFLSRLGLDSNPAIAFCRDGFYGLMDVGNTYGDLKKTPSMLIGFDATPRQLGFKNGDSIYVNVCSSTQRQMMEERQDAPEKKFQKSSILPVECDEMEGEYDYDVGSEGSNESLEFENFDL